MLILPFRRRLHWGGFTVFPGSSGNYGPGTYSITIPNYNTFTVRLWAGGGGGGGVAASFGTYNPYTAGSGGYCSFNGVIAYGGGGGQAANAAPNPLVQNGANGSPGGASGGDVNTTGGGAAGGSRAAYNPGAVQYYGGYGGNGGYAQKTWQRGAAGAPVPGQSLTLIVGGGGAGGYGDVAYGGAGSNGVGNYYWN